MIRHKLYFKNKDSFVDKERKGHYEDNLICTLLDPRFKILNFNGSTKEMMKQAEKYLKANYKANWGPKARNDMFREPPTDKSASSSILVPSSSPLAPNNGNKKKV